MSTDEDPVEPHVTFVLNDKLLRKGHWAMPVTRAVSELSKPSPDWIRQVLAPILTDLVDQVLSASEIRVSGENKDKLLAKAREVDGMSAFADKAITFHRRGQPTETLDFATFLQTVLAVDVDCSFVIDPGPELAGALLVAANPIVNGRWSRDTNLVMVQRHPR